MLEVTIYNIRTWKSQNLYLVPASVQRFPYELSASGKIIAENAKPNLLLAKKYFNVISIISVHAVKF